MNRKLWIYAILPAAINIVLFFAVVYMAVNYFPDIYSSIIQKFSFFSTPEGSIWHKILIPLVWLLKAIFFLILFMLSLLICFIAGMIISGPFNELLSEKTERLLAPNEEFHEISFIKSIPRSAIVELKKAFIFVLGPILLLLLNFIPVIGTILYMIFVNTFAAFDLGFAYADYPMERRAWKFSKRMGLAWRNKYGLMGLGCIVLIPFLAFFISAPLVVSGTILFRKMNAD